MPGPVLQFGDVTLETLVSPNAPPAVSSIVLETLMEVSASVMVNSVAVETLLSTIAFPYLTISSVVLEELINVPAISESLTDSATTSDTFIGKVNAVETLSDTVTTSDSFSGIVEQPVQTFDGMLRATLMTGANGAKLAFDGLVRSSIISAGNTGNTMLSFGGLVRETLVGVHYGFTPTDVPLNFGPIPIFPILPEGFPIKVSIVVDTTIGTTKSLREMRVAQQQFPLWDIEVPFQELLDETQNVPRYQPFLGYHQYEHLVQLWLMMYGQAGVFGFDCPWDNSRTDQIIGIGDGVTYAFNIYRTWGSGGTATLAPVGMVNSVVNVKVNGSVVPPSQYSVIRDKIYFVDANGFTYPPGNGLDITMTFTYYYLCRFVEDEQNFEEFSKNRWTVPSLKFRAVIWQ